MFSCEICENFWSTFFAEHHRKTASDCSSINSSEGRIGKQNRKLLKRAVQVSEAIVRRLQITVGVLINFVSFTRKYLCWSLFFNKVTGLNVCNSIKKRLQHSCFSVKFANFLRTLFLQFLKTVSVATSEVSLVFSKESGTKTVRLSAINTIFSWKNIFAVTKIQKQPPQMFCKRRSVTLLLERGSNIEKWWGD